MALLANRRTLLRTSLVTTAAATAFTTAPTLIFAQTPDAASGTPAAPDGPFTLPELAYAYDALEPTIDAETMELHHSKHHQAFVTNLNTALVDYPDLASLTVEEMITDLEAVPEEIRTLIRNNGGGHWNHTMLWETIGPDQGEASAELAEAVDRDLGGMETMITDVSAAGAARFGSGWAWVVSNGGTLSILSTPNQDNPLMDAGGWPILGIDVWEHAYYLSYRNRRPEYLANIWDVMNWGAISERFADSLM